MRFGGMLRMLRRRLAILRLGLRPGIRVGKNTYIAGTARLGTEHGGTITIGDRTEVLDGALLLTYGGNIVIGAGCSINAYTVIYGHGGTTIGDHVLIAGHCMIIPNSHNTSDVALPISQQGCTAKGIVVGNGVWIGHGVSVLDGVVVGAGSIIGAGAVVACDIPPFSVAVGVPARVVHQREGATDSRV